MTICRWVKLSLASADSWPGDSFRRGDGLILLSIPSAGRVRTQETGGGPLSGRERWRAGIILVNRAIHSTFASQAPGDIEIRNEYVDTSRLRDAEFMRAQAALLQRKYAGRKVDLVIAGLSSGLDFALAHRAEVFPGVPIVYVAVDQREVKARRLPPDVIGVPIQMDLVGTLDLALHFHPDTQRVFVIAGSAPFDMEWEAEARRTFRPYQDRVEFIYLTGLPMAELL